MKQTAEEYETLATEHLNSAVHSNDIELERWALSTAQVYATLAVAAATGRHSGLVG